MKNKNSEEVFKAFEEAFKAMGEPIEIFIDEETAFLPGVRNYLYGSGIMKYTKNNKNPCPYC